MTFNRRRYLCLIPATLFTCDCTQGRPGGSKSSSLHCGSGFSHYFKFDNSFLCLIRQWLYSQGLCLNIISCLIIASCEDDVARINLTPPIKRERTQNMWNRFLEKLHQQWNPLGFYFFLIIVIVVVIFSN